MAKEKQTQGESVEQFDAEKMLLENAEKGTKIKYADTVEIEIIKNGRHLKVGKVYSPHRVKAEALISQGFAKKVIKD